MNLVKSPDALKTIGEVAQDLGIATHVLRFWESKFKQIKPQKRRGRRYYRPEDVTTITQIKTLLYEQGYTIRGVQKHLSSFNATKSPEKNNTKTENVVTPFPYALPLVALAQQTTKKDEPSLSENTLQDLRDLYHHLQEFKKKLQVVSIQPA